MSFLKSISALALCLLSAQPLLGQTPAPAVSDAVSKEPAIGWQPLGVIPVDQAGAGRRGYVLPAESATVTAPDANQFSFHTVAANNFYREEAAGFLITQRFEAHTVAVGYRRGFKKLGVVPRVELGGQLQVTHTGEGMLNGFITGLEDFWVSVTGRTSSKVAIRTNGSGALPLGTLVTKDGQLIYRMTGENTGLGEMYFVAKTVLRDGGPSRYGGRVAARAAVNLSRRSSPFAQGNVAGLGVSVDQKVSEWAAVHADIRVNLFLDRVSPWGMPLKRKSMAFSGGPEFRLARTTSLNLQVDGSGTPNLPTGALAFDRGYGALTLGVSHRLRAGRHLVLAQVYARENMTLPFRVRMNTDPDLSIGLKATIQ